MVITLIMRNRVSESVRSLLQTFQLVFEEAGVIVNQIIILQSLSEKKKISLTEK